jgi:hypothetical protein
MTVTELRELISSVIDEKLAELVSDLEINDDLRERLLIQRQRVDNGDRGLPMEDVLKDLGLS